MTNLCVTSGARIKYAAGLYSYHGNQRSSTWYNTRQPNSLRLIRRRPMSLQKMKQLLPSEIPAIWVAKAIVGSTLFHEFHCDGITLGTLFFTDQLIFDLFIICLSETKFAQYFRCVSCLLGSTNWVNMLTNFRAGTRHISRDGITLR